MHISAMEEYGLRCALQLARANSGGTIAASFIAEQEGISMQYASKILHQFRKAGLVVTERGVQGGFRLSQDPGEIRLKQVFSAMRAPTRGKTTGFCQQYKGLNKECVHIGDCNVRPVWQTLTGYFDQVLERLTLADLAASEAESRRRIERHAKAAAERVEQKVLQP